MLLTVKEERGRRDKEEEEEDKEDELNMVEETEINNR